MTTAPLSDERTARCPRCGYDVRGSIATWIDSCPLEGVCTECGLTFVWCEVLHPEKFEPRWCIEFEPRALRLPLAALKTFARSLWPWGFWSRLKMSDRIRWGRLCLYVLALMVLLPSAYAAVQGSLATYVRWMVQRDLVIQAKFRPATAQNLQTIVAQLAAQPTTGDSQWDQQHQAQIAYYNGEIARLQAAGTAPDVIDLSWWETTWEAIASPMASGSSAIIVSPAGVMTMPYVAPINLLQMITSRLMGGRSNPFELLFIVFAWIGWGIGMTILLPVSFILVPVSMRKAKVRWSHIARVTMYSLFAPAMVVLLLILSALSALIVEAQSAMEAVIAAVPYVPWLLVALWWHAATSRYLKIPHAWLTIGLLTLLCLLVLLGLTALISEPLAWEMMNLFGPLVQ